MKKITVNALVDIGALVTFVPSLISGLVLFFYLPTGTGRGSAASYLGLVRDQWVVVHDNASFIFAALLIAHILLHGAFFRHINRSLFPKK